MSESFGCRWAVSDKQAGGNQVCFDETEKKTIIVTTYVRQSLVAMLTSFYCGDTHDNMSFPP